MVQVVQGMNAPGPTAELRQEEEALGNFPAAAGKYELSRRWNETAVGNGALIYHWAEYAPAGGGAHVQVGISPVLGAHDVLVCHSARGKIRFGRGPGRLP